MLRPDTPLRQDPSHGLWSGSVGRLLPAPIVVGGRLPLLLLLPMLRILLRVHLFIADARAGALERVLLCGQSLTARARSVISTITGLIVP